MNFAEKLKLSGVSQDAQRTEVPEIVDRSKDMILNEDPEKSLAPADPVHQGFSGSSRRATGERLGSWSSRFCVYVCVYVCVGGCVGASQTDSVAAGGLCLLGAETLCWFC